MKNILKTRTSLLSKRGPADFVLPIVKEPRYLLIFLAVVIIVFSYGCEGDGNVRVVDFSKTFAASSPGEGQAGEPALRMAVAAMVSPKQTLAYHRQVLHYIGNHLHRDIELIQRKTYREINALAGNGQTDLAFICSGPYATGKEIYRFELLATPEVEGIPFYSPKRFSTIRACFILND